MPENTHDPVYYIQTEDPIAVELMCVRVDFSQLYGNKGQHFKKSC